MAKVIMGVDWARKGQSATGYVVLNQDGLLVGQGTFRCAPDLVYTMLKPVLQRHLPDAVVLDYGAGNGKVAPRLESDGWNPMAIVFDAPARHQLLNALLLGLKQGQVELGSWCDTVIQHLEAHYTMGWGVPYFAEFTPPSGINPIAAALAWYGLHRGGTVCDFA